MRRKPAWQAAASRFGQPTMGILVSQVAAAAEPGSRRAGEGGRVDHEQGLGGGSRAHCAGITRGGGRELLLLPRGAAGLDACMMRAKRRLEGAGLVCKNLQMGAGVERRRRESQADPYLARAGTPRWSSRFSWSAQCFCKAAAAAGGEVVLVSLPPPPLLFAASGRSSILLHSLTNLSRRKKPDRKSFFPLIVPLLA